MASDDFEGIGAVLSRGDGATPTEAFVPLAEVREIGEISMSADTRDTTHFQSTGGYREYKKTLRDAGELSLVLAYLPGNADNALLKADFDDDLVHNYRIVFADAANTQVDFEGLVTAWGLGIPLEDGVTNNVTIKISGKPVIT